MRARIVLSAIGFASVLVLTTSCKNPNLSGGILHFDQKRYERARETLLKAIAQEPNNAEAYFWLGKAYAELDSTQQAVRTFGQAKEKYASLRPEMVKEVDDAQLHYWSVKHNDGLTYAKAAQDAKAQDKPDEATTNFRLALNQFKKARVYASDKEETPRNMGVCYFNLGEVDSGLVELKQARLLAPPGDSKSAQLLFDQFVKLAEQAFETGGLENPQPLRDAVKFYLEAKQINSEDPDLLYSLGVTYFQLAEADTASRMENYRNAVEHFEGTLTIHPDDEDALYNAASLYYELKQCEPGAAHAKHLLDLNPKEGRYYDIVGRLDDCLGKKNERVAGLVFSRALKPGAVVVAPEEYQASIEKYGSSSDAMRKFREEGKPEELRTFADAGGQEYMCWFYWTRGKALAFYNGSYKYEKMFRPLK